MAELDNKTVHCYSLKTDFLGHFFNGSKRLFEVGEVVKIANISICDCGKEALYNARQINGEYVTEGDQIVIDMEGDVRYRPVCGPCFLTKVLKKVR